MERSLKEELLALIPGILVAFFFMSWVAVQGSNAPSTSPSVPGSRGVEVAVTMLEMRVVGDTYKFREGYHTAFTVQPAFSAYPVSALEVYQGSLGKPFTPPRNPFPHMWRKREDPLPKPEPVKDFL